MEDCKNEDNKNIEKESKVCKLIEAEMFNLEKLDDSLKYEIAYEIEPSKFEEILNKHFNEGKVTPMYVDLDSTDWLSLCIVDLKGENFSLYEGDFIVIKAPTDELEGRSIIFDNGVLKVLKHKLS